MAEEKKIEQPELKLQELLDSIMSEEPTEFVFRGKRHSVGWLKKGAVRKFTHITMKEKNESKRNVKICVVLLLTIYGRYASSTPCIGDGSTTCATSMTWRYCVLSMYAKKKFHQRHPHCLPY